MPIENAAKAGGKAVASHLNLGSRYERTARLRPGLICAMTLLPVGAAFGTPVGNWIGLLSTGAGLWAVCGVALSHLASAAGNRYQEKLWPRWPYDAPTNLWLHPENKIASAQQKKKVNEAVKRLIHLDIEAAVEQGPEEVEALLNDCVTRLRHRLRNCAHADRLDAHNAQYGFARNLAGLRPLWMTFLVLSMLGCWIRFVMDHSALTWAMVSSILTVVGVLVALGQEHYVRVRARHYTDSFFSAVLELDEAEHNSENSAPKPKKAPAKKAKGSDPEKATG